jgi:hypothetical protein
MVGDALDIIGALVLAFGGIALMQELYASLGWKKVRGHVVSWQPVPSSDGKRVIGHKAQLRFDVAGVAQERESRGTSEESVMKAYPPGAEVPLRYPPGNAEMPEIAGGLVSRFSFPLIAMFAGFVCFAISTAIR